MKKDQGRLLVRVGAMVAVAVATWWLTLASFSAPLLFDPPAWVLEARWWSQFDLAPYRDLVEMKPPGMFLFLRTLMEHTAFALWPVRLSMMTLYAVAAAAFVVAASRFAPLGIAMLAALAWVWLSSHPIFVLTGCYTEELVACGSIIAVALMGMSPLAAGIALGLAATAKPLIAGVALFVWLGVSKGRWRVVAGCILGLAAVYGWMAYLIGWRVVLDECVLALVRHGSLDVVGLAPRLEIFQAHALEFFAPFPLLIAGAAAGALIGLWSRPFDTVTLLLWLFLDVVMVLAQLRAFNHHFAPMLVPLMLLACLPFGALWASRARGEATWLGWIRRGLVVGIAVAGCVAAVRDVRERHMASTEQWQRLRSGDWPVTLGEPVEAEVGGYLRAHTDPADTVHVHGQEGVTFGIYWESERRPASRYYYEGTMSRVFDAHAQAEDLARALPRYIVEISHNPADPLRPLLEKSYAIEATFHGSGQTIHCWRRNSSDAPG